MRHLNWFGAKSALAKFISAPIINAAVIAATKAALPTAFVRRLPLRVARVSCEMASGERICLLDSLRDTVARDIHWGGGRPTSPAERAKLLCIERLSKEVETFLDIGAYSGICALVAARSNQQLRAVTYEIVPENFALLVRDILANDLAVRIEAKLKGIGETNGSIRLPISMDLPSNASSVSLGSKFPAGVEIPVSTLDQETQGSTGPFFLKIDVEGYEEQVFKGGAAFIARERPDIICEVLPNSESLCEYINTVLGSLGYRWFEFTEDGCEARDQLAPRHQQRDWLLTTRKNIPEILAG